MDVDELSSTNPFHNHAHPVFSFRGQTGAVIYDLAVNYPRIFVGQAERIPHLTSEESVNYSVYFSFQLYHVQTKGERSCNDRLELIPLVYIFGETGEASPDLILRNGL